MSLNFQMILKPDGARIALGGVDITSETMGVEVKLIPGQPPHVNLGVKISTADLDLFAAEVNKQVVAGEAAPPAPPAPPAA